MSEVKPNNEDLFYAKTSALESAIATIAATVVEDNPESVVRSILLLQLERLCDLQIQALRP